MNDLTKTVQVGAYMRVTYCPAVPEGMMLVECGLGGRWGYETTRYNCQGNFALRVLAMIELGASSVEIKKVARAGNKARYVAKRRMGWDGT